jgi:hypothetical protein
MIAMPPRTAAAEQILVDRSSTAQPSRLTAPTSVGASEIKYEPTAGVPTFAVREPVLRIKPGDIVETRTFSKPGDYYERAGGPWPGDVGPFLIEGVTPEDTLVVKILKLRPNRDTAVSAVNPNGISAVAGDSRTRILNDPLPARRFVWQLDRARNVGILGAVVALAAGSAAVVAAVSCEAKSFPPFPPGAVVALTSSWSCSTRATTSCTDIYAAVPLRWTVRATSSRTICAWRRTSAS